MKLVKKSLALVLVLVLMLCAIPAVFAAAGDKAEPIAWDGTSAITIQPGETKYYSVAAGGKQITFNVAEWGQNVDILDAEGEYVASAAYMRGPMPGVIAFDDAAADAKVVFALSVAEGGVAATVTGTIADIVWGTTDMPLNLNKQFPGDYFHNATGKIADYYNGYICTYTAEVTGYVAVQAITAECDYMVYDIKNSVMITSGEVGEYLIYPVTKDQELQVVILGELDQEFVVSLTNYEAKDDPIQIQGADKIIVPVNAGAEAGIIDAANGGAWHGKGVTISAKNPADIAKTVVSYNGVDYIDIDGDNKICLTMEEVAAGGMGAILINDEFVIANNGAAAAEYTIEISAAAVEEGNCIHAHKVHHAAQGAECHTPGNIEYWYCADCDSYASDAEFDQLLGGLLSTKTPAEYELVYTEAVEVGCHQNGSNEYWYCNGCDCYFTDAFGIQNTTVQKETIPYNSDNIKHNEAHDVSCCQNGNKEYWECLECHMVFPDAELTAGYSMKNFVIISDKKTVEHVDAVEAGCHQNGMKEYWHCTECDSVYPDAALTAGYSIKDLIAFYDANNIEHVEAAEAGCHQNGTAEYWHCLECDMVFSDAALSKQTNIKNLAVPFDRTGIKHVAAVAATADKAGNKEYWICEECHDVFLDEGLTKVSNIKAVTIPKTSDIPNTGDNSIAAAAMLLLTLSVAGCAVLVIGKKKFFN